MSYQLVSVVQEQTRTTSSQIAAERQAILAAPPTSDLNEFIIILAELVDGIGDPVGSINNAAAHHRVYLRLKNGQYPTLKDLMVDLQQLYDDAAADKYSAWKEWLEQEWQRPGSALRAQLVARLHAPRPLRFWQLKTKVDAGVIDSDDFWFSFWFWFWVVILFFVLLASAVWMAIFVAYRP